VDPPPPLKYDKEFHAEVPLPIFNLPVSDSNPGSPTIRTGFAPVAPQFEAVSLLN
jgi:hypothetical protein